MILINFYFLRFYIFIWGFYDREVSIFRDFTRDFNTHLGSFSQFHVFNDCREIYHNLLLIYCMLIYF